MSPRRTLGQAREIFENDLLPRISDHWRHEYAAQLERLETEARQTADRRVSEIEREVTDLRNEALRELADTRDEMEALRRELAVAHEPAQSYATRLVNLRRRQQGANGMLADAEDLVEQAEEIEGGPIAWYDSLAQRMPHMMREVPW